MSSVRVLYSFPHTLGKPGIGTTALNQIRGLVEHGVIVDVVCTSAGRDIAGVRRVVETLVIGGQRIPHRAFGVRRAYGYHDARVAGLLARLEREVDLVHTWPAACLKTAASARRLGVPSFREVPSAHTETAYEDAAREANALGIELPKGHHHRHNAKQLERELAEFEAIDFLLVPSAYAERTFLERGFAREKLLRHRYGYDPKHFASTNGAAPANGRLGLTAVFVGRGEPNKGLHHALRAWIDSGAGDRGRFMLCGELLPSYRERIASLLEHPSVKELGFVRDVALVMRESDVLVLPSVTEGSALVTYEAQAAGCALVVSSAAGASCRHLEQGLVHEAGDTQTLTEHLHRLDQDQRLLSRLRAQALANSRTLTWSAAGERLAEAYGEGLDRFGRTP